MIMMMIHHIMAKPQKIPSYIDFYSLTAFGGKNLQRFFADYCQVAVCIFMFLAGYGIFCRYRETDSYGLKRRLSSLYFNYWLVFLIFIPIGYLFCRNQPTYAENEWQCHVFNNVGFKGVISNFIGYENSLNIEWWFVPTFAFMLTIGCLYSKRDRSSRIAPQMLLLFGFGVLLVYLLPTLETIEVFKPLVSSRLYKIIIPYDHGICECCFISGMIFAKYDKLNELIRELKKIRKPFLYGICLFIWMLIITSRDVILPRCFDIITVPITCAVLKLLLEGTGILNKWLQFIGDNSIWIWLTHSFYCYYFYFAVKIVFISRSLWIDLVILLILSTVTALVLSQVRKGADYVIHRFVLERR